MPEHAGGGRDRGQRRAQVVRHRPQQRRLDRVASPQRLRLERLLLELLAVERDREQRREPRQEPPRDPLVGRSRSRHRDRPERAARPRRAGRRPRRATGAARAERDPGVRDPEDAGSARRDPVELVGDDAAAEERRRHLGEQRRLALPLLRLAARSTRTRRELARDDRDDEVEDEHEPVLPLTEMKRVGRLEEEPVEREHARDRDRECVCEPPADRDEQNREDVQRAEGEHRDPLVEDADRSGDERDRADASQHADDDI